MGIDYLDINSKTITKHYPLLPLNETLRHLEIANICTKMDKRGPYNLHRVKEEDAYMLSIRTLYGLIELTVIQFVTTNAQADFQGYINYSTREAFDDVASTCLDDVLMHSDSEEEPVGHVPWILQQFLEAGIYLNPEKCGVHKETVKYLGLIISTKGISMNNEMVETVLNWSQENKTMNGWLNILFEVQ
jgi:hypothetical protein